MKYTPLGEAENASYTGTGNPEHGILGSTARESCGISQREVVKVIQEAGLTPSDNDLTQLCRPSSNNGAKVLGESRCHAAS